MKRTQACSTSQSPKKNTKSTVLLRLKSKEERTKNNYKLLSRFNHSSRTKYWRCATCQSPTNPKSRVISNSFKLNMGIGYNAPRSQSRIKKTRKACMVILPKGIKNISLMALYLLRNKITMVILKTKNQYCLPNQLRYLISLTNRHLPQILRQPYLMVMLQKSLHKQCL